MHLHYTSFSFMTFNVRKKLMCDQESQTIWRNEIGFLESPNYCYKSVCRLVNYNIRRF